MTTIRNLATVAASICAVLASAHPRPSPAQSAQAAPAARATSSGSATPSSAVHTTAYTTAHTTTGEIDAHIRFLASDLLEGRAPATRGGQLAMDYIASAARERPGSSRA